ncbi:NAD(P)-binding protein [Meredithblackwellia eburnea MCA 4105]
MPKTVFDVTTTAEQAALALNASIQGKVVLITGPTLGGLGAEAARAIAKQMPALIILAGRSANKLKETSASILTETPSAHVRTVIADFSSYSSIKAAAAEINKYSESIDVLINNSGIMGTSWASVEGFESQFAINHLGPFLFTNLIRPKLNSSGARVVNLTSAAHALCPVLFDDVNFDDGKKYDKWAAYAQSKTANVSFAVGMNDKWENVESFSVHPGVISTGIMRHTPKEELIAIGFYDADGNEAAEAWGGFKTLGQGAATMVIAAFDPELAGHGGSYLLDGQLANDKAAPHALDKDSAEKLWKLSASATGL